MDDKDIEIDITGLVLYHMSGGLGKEEATTRAKAEVQAMCNEFLAAIQKPLHAKILDILAREFDIPVKEA